MFGGGIHPAKSSICRSAIADRSMPFSGGIFGVAILTGLPNYEGNADKIQTRGIDVQSYSTWSQKSFVTFKVDNFDFSSTDYRILDHKGQNSAIGRIEYRQGGAWGTLCMK